MMKPNARYICDGEWCHLLHNCCFMLLLLLLLTSDTSLEWGHPWIFNRDTSPGHSPANLTI
jgi:hypothetical protein